MSLTPKQTIKGTVAGAQSVKGVMKDIPSLDKTLTKEGYAAEAKAVGEALNARTIVATDPNNDGNIVLNFGGSGGSGGGSADIDIQEIVDAVIAALPIYNGEVEDV